MRRLEYKLNKFGQESGGKSYQFPEIIETKHYASHDLLISFLVSILNKYSYTYAQRGMPSIFHSGVCTSKI